MSMYFETYPRLESSGSRAPLDGPRKARSFTAVFPVTASTAASKLRDADIRKLIRGCLIDPILAESPSRLVEEMVVCGGEARVDLAVINGKLHGFEIKSEADTLERLRQQAEIYSRVFDTMAIVTSRCHVKRVSDLVPEWWAIHTINGDETIECLQRGTINMKIDARATAQFLWKNELLEILAASGVPKTSRLPRRELWTRAATAYEVVELQRLVRDKLQSRADWRSDSPQM